MSDKPKRDVKSEPLLKNEKNLKAEKSLEKQTNSKESRVKHHLRVTC